MIPGQGRREKAQVKSGSERDEGNDRGKCKGGRVASFLSWFRSTFYQRDAATNLSISDYTGARKVGLSLYMVAMDRRAMPIPDPHRSEYRSGELPVVSLALGGLSAVSSSGTVFLGRWP